MREARVEEFDGRVLNPSGVEIDIPFWVFKRLKKLHLIERDRDTGKLRICDSVFGLMEIWDGPDFKPRRRLRALDPRRRKIRPKGGGFSNAFLTALGRDCSGLVNPAGIFISREHER